MCGAVLQPSCSARLLVLPARSQRGKLRLAILAVQPVLEQDIALIAFLSVAVRDLLGEEAPIFYWI
jgi:hypothetical protein